MALLDRTIDGGARTQVEDHLKECRLCECEYQALVAAESMLRRHALVRHPAPAGLIDRVMQRLQKTPRIILFKELGQLAAVAVMLLGIFTMVASRYSYSPVVDKVQGTYEETREYVTKDLPRAIAAGFNALWERTSHE
jgi:predicted anti-sigma-YlaC factor YlaD